MRLLIKLCAKITANQSKFGLKINLLIDLLLNVLQNENINSPATTTTTQSSQKKFVRHGTITEGEKTPTTNGGSVSILEHKDLITLL